MFKKLLSTFLTVALLASFATTALAAKKGEDQWSTGEPNNIFAIWGDFEHPNAINNLGRYSAGTQSIVEGGPDGTGHCLKVNNCEMFFADLKIFMGGMPGETYDLSLDIKAENPLPSNLEIQLNHPGNGYSLDGWKWKAPITQEWTKVEIEITCPSKDFNGKEVTGITHIQLRFNGAATDSVYIDNLSVVPHGDIPFDYAPYQELNFYGMPGDREAPARAAETGDSDFSDVASEHWANDAIDSLARNNYVNGIGDGLYSPNTNVTRAQFIKMVTNLYKDAAPEYDGRFGDVSANQWFASPIMLAEKLNLLNDAFKADGNIYPDKPITREEAAAIAAIVAADRGAKPASDAVSSFNDEADITDWAKEGVKNAAAFGMINGYEDGTYKPKNNITRAEAAQILFRIVEVSARLNIYVDDATGKDTNDGTKTAPLKSIEAARDLATKLAPTMQNDITIRIRGKQFLESTFELNEKHSGKNGYSIVYTSWGDDKATITMNKEYTGFTLHDADKNIWKTYVGEGTYSRQAYFNDVRGIRSRSIGYLENITRVDTGGYHFLCDNTELLSYKYPKEIDMVFHVLWLNDRFLIDSITEEAGRVKIVPHSKYKSSERTIINGANQMRGTPSYIENAYELLDEAGEWYLNKHDGYMYYIPRTGEDMSTMVCKIPTGENLIIARGSDYKKPLKNVKFDNIIFEGTTWLYPDRKGGFHSIQGNYVMEPTEVQESLGSVHFSKAQNIAITNSVFRQLGFTGLDVADGSSNVDIIGNEFYNIGSTAMMIDDFRHYMWFYEDHSGGRPNHRLQETWCDYINVMNNYVHDVTTDYNGAAAITVGFPRHTKFHHNELSFMPYSGFHIGWGWAGMLNTGSISYDLEICYNYIHDIMAGRVNDGAAIYNLGSASLEIDKYDDTQKNKYIGNYFANGWNADYVYPDDGSNRLYVANNVSDKSLVKEQEYNFDRTPAPKSEAYWMHLHSPNMKWITTRNNYADVDYAKSMMNGEECDIEPTILVKDGNWPQEAIDIMNNAGIEPEYRDNFNLDAPKVLACDDRWATFPLNEPTKTGLMILGHHNKQYPLSDFDIRFWVEDDAATLDENGYITAHKEGVYEAEVVVTIGEVTQTQHMMMNLGTDVAEISFGSNSAELISGFQSYLTVTGITSYGMSTDITSESEINLVSSDESVASISKSADGKKLVLSGNAQGQARFTGTIVNKGKTFNVDIPVVVKEVKFGSKEAESLPFREVNFQTGWAVEGKPNDGGTQISGMPNRHSVLIENELVAFDVSVDPGSDWPSFAFCDNSLTGDYNTSDCYMYGICKEHIEIQKFVAGKRTMFYGPYYSPIAGPGIPNLEGGKVIEYNKRYSIVMGALDTPEGTRLILTVNGKNILDYTDKTADKIKATGYMCVYNPTGMTFYPYSGMTD